MAVQKNFLIHSGLEVNNNLIFANKDSNKVGIATTNPQYNLHVSGGIGVTNSIVTGFSTVNNLVVDGRFFAGGNFGVIGQYLVSTGSGVTWTSVPTVRSTDVLTAGVGATTFSTTYSVGLLDVYVNGVKLSPNEYTANNGATVSFDDACFGGETIEFISYSPFGIGIGGTALEGITILNEGFQVGSPLQVTSIDFVGAAVTVSGSGIGVTVYIADHITSSDVATYAVTAGVATYANTAGIATVSQGLTGTPNIQVGIVTATNVVIGAGVTQLIVNGVATISETLLLGSISLDSLTENVTIGSSITIDGSAATVLVGSGLTSVTIDGGTGTINATHSSSSGVTTSQGGFTSGIGVTDPVQITVSGNVLTFNVVGVGSTSLTLY